MIGTLPCALVRLESMTTFKLREAGVMSAVKGDTRAFPVGSRDNAHISCFQRRGHGIQ